MLELELELELDRDELELELLLAGYKTPQPISHQSAPIFPIQQPIVSSDHGIASGACIWATVSVLTTASVEGS
jgi:hypothetical protein